MFVKEFQCNKCKHIQEQWLRNSNDPPTDSCEKCQAPASAMKPILSSFGKHVSWSTWNVSGN